jgi:thiamine biosynthesis protein ThiS
MGPPEKKMRLRVNGAEMELDPDTTLTQVLESLGLDRRFLVVEYNGEPLSRDAFDATVLREGDRLELVRPVAGG